MNKLQKWVAKALGIEAQAISRIVMPWNSQWSPHLGGADITSFADKGYGGNPYVFSVVNQIATMCSGIPWSLYRVRDEKAMQGYRRKTYNGIGKLDTEARELKTQALEQIDQHDLVGIMRRPNSLQTWTEFVEMVQGFKQIAGNSFILGVKPDSGPNAGRPVELVPYRPDRVVIVAPDWPAAVVAYKVGEKQAVWSPDDVLHLKTFHPTNPRIGMSPIEAAFLAVKTSNMYALWNYSLTENMGSIPGVLTIDIENPTQAQIDSLLQRFRERQAGAPNAGFPAVGSKVIGWEPTAWSPKDMEWINGVQLTADQVALAYRWPVQLLGNSKTSIYNNVREANRSAYLSRILPEMDNLRDALNEFLVRPWNSPGVQLYLDYNVEDIEALQEDRAAVWERTIRAWSSGLLSLNESRLELGFDGVGPEGDVRQIPIGLMGQDSLSAEDEAFQKALKALYSEGLDDYQQKHRPRRLEVV